MNIVQKIGWKAGRYFLKGEMKNLRKQTVAVGFDDSAKIGILYDASVKDNYEAVKNFVRRIRNLQKDVKSLGFINSRTLPGDQFIKLGMDFFTLADVNWHYKPSGKVTSNFMKEDFDVVINFSMDECLPLEYISVFSKTKFRIGKYSERNKQFYDFMIDLKTGDSIAKFVNDVEHYLQVINSKHSPVTNSNQ